MEMIRVKVLGILTGGKDYNWESSDNQYIWVSPQHIESIMFLRENAYLVMDSGNIYGVESVNMEDILRGDTEKW